MQAIKLILALLWLGVGVSWGQPPCVLLMETDEILTAHCAGGNCLPDGTPVCIYWDGDSDGPDACDDIVPVGEPGFNFSCFALNGEEVLGQCGQFFLEVCWQYQGGGFPTPNRFYLRTCGPEVMWVSQVFSIAPGPQEIEMGPWTCSATCNPVPPPPIHFNSLYYPFECPCGSGQELTLPINVQIRHDENRNGPDESDSVWALLDWRCPPSHDDSFYCWTDWFTLCVDSTPMYLQINDDGCCFRSEVVWVSMGPWHYDLFDWTCANSNCGTPPGPELTITFANCLQYVGGPCENPNPFPDGTPIIFRHDLTANGPSVDDENLASFPYSRGSGLPPWDCNWVPLPGVQPSGRHYVTINSGVCCWTTRSFLLEHQTEITIVQSDWRCSNSGCLAPQGNSPPPPPGNVEGTCEGGALILSWTGSGIEDSFAISVNGARIGVVPANVHQWNDNLAPPGIRTYCVIAINEFGESPPSCVTVDCSGGIVQAALPHRDRLGPDGIRISPNPFNPTTRIEFELTEAQHVQLNIFDIQGRVVETLVNEQLASGTHSHLWDAAQMPSGIYWAQLVAGSDIRIEKLLLMK